MKIVIHVVKDGDELLFRTASGLLFDKLSAWKEFAGGGLSILRDGRLFDETEAISEYGTHGACTCFCGLTKLFKSADLSAFDTRAWAVSALHPADMQEGDVLIIDADHLPGNFDIFLRTMCRGMIAMMRVFEEHDGSVTLGELRQGVQQKLAEEAEEQPRVVRFGEKTDSVLPTGEKKK